MSDSDPKEEADWLRALIDAVPVVLTYVDRDLRYRITNRFYNEHYGRGSEADPVGKHAREVLGDAAFANLEPAFERVLAGERVELETEVARTGKSPLTVVGTYIPIRDRAGALQGFAAFSQDVTVQRAAERQLVESERQLRLLADAIPHMVWVTNPEGQIEHMNERWYAYTGLPAGSANERWVESIHPDDATRIQAQVARSVSEGVPYETEYRIRRRDGAYRWHLGRTAFVHAPDGSISKRFGTATDIHDHKITEHRLITLHRVSSELVDAGSVDEVASTLATIMYETLGANRSSVFVLDASGLSLERRGYRAETALPPEPGPFSINDSLISCRAVREKKSIWLAEAPAEFREDAARRTGMPASAFSSMCALPIMVGERVLGVVTLTFTERRNFGAAERGHSLVITRVAGAALERASLFDAERRARAEAENANRVKDEFLAMLGHELRNPLAPIRTTLDLMNLRGDTALVRERTVIERQVRHLSRLVDDLLDVSRISSSRLDVQHARIDLSEVTAQAVEMTMPIIEQRRHRLTVDVPPGLVLSGDRTRLAQVVSNLLVNAAKYTPNNGHIALTAKANGGEVIVSVRDDGIGIDPSLLPIVFDLFAQGPQSSDRKQGGLGLGLAIARSLVELHGGTITARSEGAGRGTEVTVRLPLAEGVAAPAPPAPVSAVADARGNVLVVDDNEDAGDLLALALQSKGFAVKVARDGREALAIVDSYRPDLAILDIGLPEMDGYELARRLRGRSELANLRLVALTGYGQSADRARTAAAGFDRHLVKPVELDQLERTVVALLMAKPT